MIRVSTNLGQVTAELQSKMKLVRNEAHIKDKLLRTMATSTAPVVAQRIHVDGKKADGSQIGEYSNPYMRVRFKNKRDTSKKVIFSLTRQMENDFGPVATNTGYGLGFKNPDNTQKAKWLTEDGVGKNKVVFDHVYELSNQERDLVHRIAEQYITDAFA